MRIKDYVRLGMDQLKRRVVVTSLCALGIAIGSASIMVALAFGESASYYTQKQMSYYLKTDEITIMDNQQGGGGRQQGSLIASQQQFGVTDQKLDLLRTHPQVQSILRLGHLGYFNFTADETKQGSLQLIATNLETLPDFGFEFQQGAVSDADNTIVLTYGATMNLYDERTSRIQRMQAEQSGLPQDAWRMPEYIAYPLYQKTIMLQKREMMPDGTMRSAEFPVRVVGVLKKEEGVPDSRLSNDRTGYISQALAERIKEATAEFNQSDNFYRNDEIKVKVASSSYVPDVEDWIRKLRMNAYSNLHQQERMQREFVIIRVVFAGAGLFVLFVASISIIVAMTMSTHQRRRQIGIMKVLGANLRQIRNMFIVESALLGVLGGLIGILFTHWVIWGINIMVIQFGNAYSEPEILFISPWILPMGMVFAILTGVMSGILPAVKASRMDALTAIKRE